MGASYDTGSLRDQGTIRVCNLAGLNRAHKSLVTLRDLDRGTELALKEVEKARTKAQFFDRALVVARFTKATCDAFIGLAAELSGNKAAGKVADAYGASSVAAGVVGDLTAGKRVDKFSLTVDVLKAGAAYAGTNAGYGMKSVAVKSEMVRGAMNASEKDVLKSAMEYSADLASYTLDHLKEMEGKTGKGAGIVNKFLKIGREIFTYNDKVGETFDAYLKDQEDTRSSFDAQKRTLKSSGEHVRRQIRALDQFIKSCEEQLNSPQKSAPIPPLARARSGGTTAKA